MNYIICATAIRKTFGAGEEKQTVLDGVSVRIRSGEFVSVMGPSGSGKSTLLYALSGMDRIDSGDLLFADQALSGLTDDALSELRRNRMGFVFQQPTLLKNLDLLDNIILPMSRGRRRNAAQLTAKALRLMKETGIVELAHREITQVSGGQLQRAGICRALMNDPEILFCDEPTGALNARAANEVMALFSRIHAAGTAILLVTHDPGVAARSERVLFLYDGKLVTEVQLGSFTGADLERRTDRILQIMRHAGI